MSAPQSTRGTQTRPRPQQGRAPAGTAQGNRPRTAPKKRRRRNGAGRRAFYLFIVLLGIAGVMYMALRLFAGPGGEKAVSASAPAPTHLPVTPVPSATPVPTPTPPAVDVNSWELRLIRYETPLGADFVPESLTEIENGQQVDSRIAQPLKDLFGAARAAGYDVYFCSGYRDYNTQHIIYFDNHVDVYMAQGMSEAEANAKARLAVNYPGSSEHQSGLCADILESPDQDMEPYIGGSGLMLWLEEHCAKYGFVIRYPDDKTDITGVEYEPWHLRYVGETAAKYMMEHGLCLEEFLALYGVTYS